MLTSVLHIDCREAHTRCAASSLRELSEQLGSLHAALLGPLAQFEERVKTHAQPSRVLAWAVPMQMES